MRLREMTPVLHASQMLLAPGPRILAKRRPWHDKTSNACRRYVPWRSMCRTARHPTACRDRMHLRMRMRNLRCLRIPGQGYAQQVCLAPERLTASCAWHRPMSLVPLSQPCWGGEEDWAEVLAISKEISWRQHAASKSVSAKRLHSAEVWACWPWQWSRCERHGLGGETATTAEIYCVHPLVKLFYAMA